MMQQLEPAPRRLIYASARFIHMEYPNYKDLAQVVLTNEEVAALISLMEDLDESDRTPTENQILQHLKVAATIDIAPTMTRIEKIMAKMKEKYTARPLFRAAAAGR